MEAKKAKSAGRPIGFDRESALFAATEVFREKGFEGASLHDLTAAMGIRPPSLYAAFGNKESLFEECLLRYLAGPAAYMREALTEKTAYRVAERILFGTAEFLTGGGSGCGCLTIQGGMAGSSQSKTVRRRLSRLRVKGLERLQRRFERGRTEGDLPKSANAADLARYVTTVFQGMTVQATDGATREELLRVAEMALRRCPTT